MYTNVKISELYICFTSFIKTKKQSFRYIIIISDIVKEHAVNS